jgi:glycolate oxidase
VSEYRILMYMSSAHDSDIDDVLPEVDCQRLIACLRGLLPLDSVLTTDEQQRPFECDGLSSYQQMPLVTVLPETVEQVCAVMRLSSEQGVPVVTRGAGTGLSGGAMPCANGVLLVLSKMNRVLEIDADNLSARVQPGVRNLAISEAVAHHGLYYAPDPSSQIACSIGGNVAENAGGVHCLKYGLTVHNIQHLKLVTLGGELLEVDGHGDSLDLLPLLVGSEGMLAVVVEITVELKVSAPVVETLLCAFDSVQLASDAVAAIIAAGIIPAGLEMMDKLALTAAEDFVGAGYPRDAEAILLLELDGCASEVNADLALAKSLMADSGATEVRQALDQAQRELFWKGRKNAFPAVGRLFPDYYCMDGTIPRRAIAEVLGWINATSKQRDMPVANVFHAGDGNLHPLILFDANVPGALAAAEEFGAMILEKCIAVGGTITGEHGVGREKINQMASQFSDAELEQFRRVKAAFDGPGLLNPGKNIPTLKRCQEYRAIGRGRQ